MRSLVLFLLLATSLSAFGQRVPIYDLRNDWKVLEGNTYVNYEDRKQSGNTVHFTLDAQRFRSYQLEIDGPRKFSVWVNNQLIRQSGQGVLRFSVDSLASVYRSPMSVSVFADRGLSLVKTSIITFSTHPSDHEELVRNRNHLRDFSVLAVFILCMGLLFLLRFNRRLLFDYFDFTRLLSFQERDESLVAGRITSRFSVSIYVYLSAWAAFLFLVVFQYVGENWIIVSDLKVRGLGSGFAQWGKITMFIAFVFFLKVSIALALSVVFRLREGGSIQVLNFFRLVSFLLMILSIVMLIYFIAATKSPAYYQALVTTTVWIMGGWGILIFLKLLNKSPYSVFHLFSYLCASEYFPIIILFKSLFF